MSVKRILSRFVGCLSGSLCLCAGAASISCFLAAPASAEITTYQKPALNNIIKTLVRMDSVDIYDDDVLDIFLRTNECGLYQTHYADAFKWEKIRNIMRDQIKKDIATYPVGYKYNTLLKLDRYDFKKKIYPFAAVSSQQNVNTFIMQASFSDYCKGTDVKGFPNAFKLILDKPIVLEGLPLNEEQGEALFNRMNAIGNTSHVAYASFNIRVVFVAPLARPSEARALKAGTLNLAKIRQDVQMDSVRLDSQLDSIEFFEDENRTKLIYRYRP